MPIIEPFRALRYAPSLARELDRLVTPPYDVISAERRAALAARHPRNMVHLDLPGAPGSEEAYAAAARALASWRADGTLVRDPRPLYYACEQTYTDPGGARRTRRGFFARLRLSEFGAGAVVPHENTLERPRADRLRLLEATRAHLSAVFLLHPDPGAVVSHRVRDACAAGGAGEARDDDGTVSRVAVLQDVPPGSLAARLESTWALIADGHHRYESALAYRDGRRAAGFRDAEHVLAFFCSLEDPGLAIFPIHRLVHGLADFEPESFLERLDRLFVLERVRDLAAARQTLAARRGRPGTIALALRDVPGLVVATWREGAGLDAPGMTAVPEPLRTLDVILVHRLVLEGILGITPEEQARQTRLDYAKDDAEVETRVRRGAADLGILMNPTRIEQVIEVGRRGLRLPQKSTYFYPKVLTGLVLDPLDDRPDVTPGG